MGKLRLEPKIKPLLDDEEYNYYKNVVLEAEKASSSHHVFWDLDQGEKPQQARKALLYVAEKEGKSLKVRAQRGAQSLSLRFEGVATPTPSTARMSAEESKKAIITALSKAKTPLKKSSIVAATGVSPSTWNIRIKQLLKEGAVKRAGAGRDTVYSLTHTLFS